MVSPWLVSNRFSLLWFFRMNRKDDAVTGPLRGRGTQVVSTLRGQGEDRLPLPLCVIVSTADAVDVQTPEHSPSLRYIRTGA